MNGKSLLIIGVIGGMIIGIVVGMYLLPQDYSSYENQIHVLNSEIELHEEIIENMSKTIDNLNQEIIIIRNDYQSLQTELSSLKSLQIDVDLFVTNLMKPRDEHPWQEGYRNADIQAVIVVRRGDKYYDDLFFEIKEKMEAKGGAAVEGSRSASGGYYTPVAQELESGRYAALIEYYGIEHIAILHLGGPVWAPSKPPSISEVYQNPLFPTFNQLPLIALDPKYDQQFFYILNKPR